MRRAATASVTWMEFSNEDIGDPEPDAGWYVTIDIADRSFDIGPDPTCESGYQSVDGALAAVAKWAADRGLMFVRPSPITVAIVEVKS